MSRKDKGTAPISKKGHTNRKGNTMEPNDDEAFGVDNEEQRRKRKEGKGYAKTTPTDPIERDKLYAKRNSQKKASKKFRDKTNRMLEEAEECKKEYNELKADYEKLQNAYTEITSKIDIIRRYLNGTPSTILNVELMLSMLQYTPISNFNESSEGSASTEEVPSGEESDEEFNQRCSQSESTTSMSLLSLNQQPQSLPLLEQNLQHGNQQRSSQLTITGTMPYDNWNEHPPTAQHQRETTYGRADVNQVDPAVPYSNGNIQQPAQQQQHFNTVIYQFGDSPVEVSIDYSDQHVLQGTIPSRSFQPTNSSLMSTTPSYQQPSPSNQHWQQRTIPPQHFLGSSSSNQHQYANLVPIEPGRTFLINSAPMHQHVQQYGAVTSADYAPSRSATHSINDHSFTEPYKSNGNPLTVPRAPRPNSFMVTELPDRTENNRRVTKANRRYSTYVPPQEAQNANDLSRPVTDAEKDSPYAKKSSRDS